MFAVSWFNDILSFLGLRTKRGAKLLLLGLDNAGKTTLLHLLRDDRMVQHLPTQHPTSEEIVLPGGIRFTAFDLGGHQLVRCVWRDYFPAVDAVAFLVDAAQPRRLSEARAELDALLSEPCLSDVPFLILGNKIDLPGAISEDDLREALGLGYVTATSGGAGPRGGAKGWGGWGLQGWGLSRRAEAATAALEPGLAARPVGVFMCSLTRRMGYGEGFRWLAQYIK